LLIRENSALGGREKRRIKNEMKTKKFDHYGNYSKFDNFGNKLNIVTIFFVKERN